MLVRAKYYPPNGLIDGSVYVEVSESGSFDRCIADFNIGDPVTARTLGAQLIAAADAMEADQ